MKCSNLDFNRGMPPSDETRSHSASQASGSKSSALGLREIVDRYPVRYLDLAIGGQLLRVA